jgi:hypothetical protein
MAEGLEVEDSSCQIQPGLDETSEGFKLFPELEVLAVDMRARKIKYNAFTPGSSDLDLRLKARGIDTLLIGARRDDARLQGHHVAGRSRQL